MGQLPAILTMIIVILGLAFMVTLAIYDIVDDKNKKQSNAKPVGELIIQKSDQTCYIAIDEEVANKIPNMKQITLSVKVRK